MDPDEAYELLHTGLMLDGRETLNLASFVTTWMEPQAEALIHDNLRKNHIDHEEYPAASLVEEACVHMLADLFNAPDPGQAVGVGTIGSSEAIMLGLLAHKRAWRNRRAAAGLPTDRPNVVYGAETHVVWDKFANYFDVEMRKIPMRPDRFVLSADDVEKQIDENTIAVGAVLGTTTSCGWAGPATPRSSPTCWPTPATSTNGSRPAGGSRSSTPVWPSPSSPSGCAGCSRPNRRRTPDPSRGRGPPPPAPSG
jgi:glutamate decarboxylase